MSYLLPVALIYLDPSVSFGKLGTVTGIYRFKVEVIFDEPFIGASSLSGRCDFFRGAVLDILEIFNLSESSLYLNRRKDIVDALELTGPSKVSEWNRDLDGFELMEQVIDMRKEMLGEDIGEYMVEQKKHERKFIRRLESAKNDIKFKKPGQNRRKGHQNKKKKKEEVEDECGFFEEIDEEKKDE